MEITPKFFHVEGSFDTQKVEMICIPSEKHGMVNLCFRDGTNIKIGEIILYSGSYSEFKESYEDATKLGNEIARRWNECKNKK